MRPPRLRYEPAHTLGGRPHVMVDGAARPGTTLTLSHWAGQPTPDRFRADLSAEIVGRALARPRALRRAGEVATIDHYDEDGVVALAMLCDPDLAAAVGPLLVETARVGDFGVVTDRRAALIAFAVAAIARPETTPVTALAGAERPEDALQVTALAATEALRLAPALVDHVEEWSSLWGPEAAVYDAAAQALRDGAIVIEERADEDLAIVLVDRSVDPANVAWGADPVHRGAVHSATTCLRIVTVVNDRVEFAFRYESWVRLVSRRARPRVDLTSLVDELQAMEPGGATWEFTGARATRPRLRVADGGRSEFEPEVVVARLRAAFRVLDQGPPAWDPYRSA